MITRWQRLVGSTQSKTETGKHLDKDKSQENNRSEDSTLGITTNREMASQFRPHLTQVSPGTRKTASEAERLDQALMAENRILIYHYNMILVSAIHTKSLESRRNIIARQEPYRSSNRVIRGNLARKRKQIKHSIVCCIESLHHRGSSVSKRGPLTGHWTIPN